MKPHEIEHVVRNIDRRLEQVEQILPTLATREELHAAIQAAVAPLATRAEMREEAIETRRHFDVVAESLRDDIRLIAEGQATLSQKFDVSTGEFKQDIAKLDVRVTRLEASRRRR
jgi:hypothetical protein